MVNKPWITGMENIAAYLDVGETKVLELIRGYGLPARKLFGQWRALPEDLDEWVRGKLKEDG